MIDVKNTIPSEFFNKNLSDRKPYEDRAQAISEVSLPYVFRAEGSDGGTALFKSVSQSFNGRQVNNLKSKMGMALLPPATSSFRLKPDAIAMVKLFQGN